MGQSEGWDPVVSAFGDARKARHLSGTTRETHASGVARQRPRGCHDLPLVPFLVVIVVISSGQVFTYGGLDLTS
jgi:hypothetical protein